MKAAHQSNIRDTIADKQLLENFSPGADFWNCFGAVRIFEENLDVTARTWSERGRLCASVVAKYDGVGLEWLASAYDGQTDFLAQARGTSSTPSKGVCWSGFYWVENEASPLLPFVKDHFTYDWDDEGEPEEISDSFYGTIQEVIDESKDLFTDWVVSAAAHQEIPRGLILNGPRPR